MNGHVRGMIVCACIAAVIIVFSFFAYDGEMLPFGTLMASGFAVEFLVLFVEWMQDRSK